MLNTDSLLGNREHMQTANANEFIQQGNSWIKLDEVSEQKSVL